MKVALVLLGLFAASQAAFTSRLTRESEIILRDAVTKMRMSTTAVSFRESDIATQIIDSMHNTAQSLISQIQASLQEGQQMAANVINHFQLTVFQLQQLGMGSNVHSSVASVLQNFLNGISGASSQFGKGVTNEIVGSAVLNLLTQWNLDHHIINALNHNVVQWIAGLIGQLGVNSLVQIAVSSVIGSDMSDFIFLHLNSSRSLTASLQGMVGQVSAASQQLFANLGQTIQQMTSAAQEHFQQLQTLATQMAADSIVQVQSTVNEAGAEFITFVQQYQQAFGDLYEQVVAQVGSLVGTF